MHKWTNTVLCECQEGSNEQVTQLKPIAYEGYVTMKQHQRHFHQKL